MGGDARGGLIPSAPGVSHTHGEERLPPSQALGEKLTDSALTQPPAPAPAPAAFGAEPAWGHSKSKAMRSLSLTSDATPTPVPSPEPHALLQAPGSPKPAASRRQSSH